MSYMHEFNLEQFVRFMMTQSNVNEQIKAGNKTETEVYDFFKNTLKTIFNNRMRTLIFDGYSWYIKHRV